MPAKAATKTVDATEQVTQKVELQRIEPVRVEIPIVGKTPLIPHKWSEKAIRMMEQKQSQPGVRAKREAKDPQQEAHDSCYWLYNKAGKEIPAMPATAFKAAMVGACRFFEGLTMTIAKQIFYVVGEGPDQLVPITGDMTMRQDTPRNSGGVADLRYRHQFDPWSAVLTIEFIPQIINGASVVALLDAAGRGGVGDWRPSSPKSATGTYGQWSVPA